MKKKRFYYKAIDERNGDLRSAVTTFTFWMVKYNKGEWVEGNEGSLLFVFNTAEEAKRWSQYEKIWKCEVKKPRVVKWMGCWATGSSLCSWWKLKKRTTKNSYSVPRGTRMCEAVKLVERV